MMKIYVPGIMPACQEADFACNTNEILLFSLALYFKHSKICESVLQKSKLVNNISHKFTTILNQLANSLDVQAAALRGFEYYDNAFYYLNKHKM